MAEEANGARDETFAQYESLLQNDEKKRANAYLFEHLRRDFIFGRALLRLLLHRYTGVSPEKIVFSYDRYGKPSFLDEGGNARISFSVSNTKGMLLIAMTLRGRIGVDVEHTRADGGSRNMALYCLSPAELSAYEEAEQDAESVFFHYWCRKEAYLKAQGTGLIDNLPGIDTSAKEVFADGRASGFFCCSLSLFPGYYAALCYDKKLQPHLSLRRFFLPKDGAAF